MNQLPSFIEQEFRAAIDVAANDQHDIESEYEDVIRAFKTVYPGYTAQIDELWAKMCQLSETDEN